MEYHHPPSGGMPPWYTRALGWGVDRSRGGVGYHVTPDTSPVDMELTTHISEPPPPYVTMSVGPPRRRAGFRRLDSLKRE